uniref:Uncharacterized protein n=1 Tax=Myotis myotis TaxID=51298 RepID=A0A7J7UPR4_MYOMY|nr:hypothetical protein mMyoMyo1_008625 [Myotis myotis]
MNNFVFNTCLKSHIFSNHHEGEKIGILYSLFIQLQGGGKRGLKSLPKNKEGPASLAQWLSVSLRTRRSLFDFPVRAHAGVAGSIPWAGVCVCVRAHVRRRQPIADSLSLIFLSFPPSLKSVKIYI